VLPLALRDALDDTIRAAVITVSRVFKRLCSREIKIVDHDSDMDDAAEALCLLEKSFPPTFMDHVMSHLMIFGRRTVHVWACPLQVDVSY
jgi:hypothetical protein